MITVPKTYATFSARDPHHCTVFIQAPLPRFRYTLPILITIEGQGSGRQGPSPLAPSREPAND